MSCPDIADWVAALISRTGDGVGGTWTPHIVWQSSVGFQSMAVGGDRQEASEQARERDYMSKGSNENKCKVYYI